jgi:ribonucleoside-diphosphate reductase alpha chain
MKAEERPEPKKTTKDANRAKSAMIMIKGKEGSATSTVFDAKRAIEALIRERGLSLDEAHAVVAEVKAEIEAQNLTELPTDTLKALIDTKVHELRHRFGLAKKESDNKTMYFDDPDLDIPPNALSVLERRYLKKDHQGRPMEKPQHMFRRVAREIARIDRLYEPEADTKIVEDEFYRLMTNFEFMPNSPTLMNAGRELGQLSACFVIPIGDSLDSIFEAVKHTAMIHKSGGGTGFSFSRLRPHNDVVNTTRGVASGPISFMRVFDSATEEIKQGGTRRGANMGILNVDHPDIKDFIHCKDDKTKLTNFNISVGLTEEFMSAVEADHRYALKNPRTGEIIDTLSAREVFNEIVMAAWTTGEPGIVFIDRMDADNPNPDQGKIESTNPCGEQPLLPYESCNLGSINLAKVVANEKIDWDKLGSITRTAVHFLDNVIDANKYPLDLIELKTKTNRKIGLGIMGFADMLVELGVPYNSDEATGLAEEIMTFIRDQGRQQSAELAQTRGPFPSFENSTYNQPGMPPLRNSTITTIAPTGTISIISGASSGIEPYFAISYVRTCMDNDELVEVNPFFERVAREQGFYSEELMKEIAAKGSIQEVEAVPVEVRSIFVTAMDIDPEWHVRMQAAFQKATDNAVSKTVNFPKSATPDDIAEVYWLAYRTGCKGVTVYRDGSRDNQVLEINKDGKKELVAEMPAVPRGHLEPRPRPDEVRGITRKMPTGCGSLYVTINEDDEGMFEVFTNMGKSGGCAASQAEAVSRLISLALRAGIKTEEIVRQLKGISCPMIAWWEGQKIHSCADALAKSIENYPAYTKNGSKKVEAIEPAGNLTAVFEGKARAPKIKPERLSMAMCPECGGTIEFKEGCLTCQLCGFTKC